MRGIFTWATERYRETTGSSPIYQSMFLDFYHPFSCSLNCLSCIQSAIQKCPWNKRAKCCPSIPWYMPGYEDTPNVVLHSRFLMAICFSITVNLQVEFWNKLNIIPTAFSKGSLCSSCCYFIGTSKMHIGMMYFLRLCSGFTYKNTEVNTSCYRKVQYCLWPPGVSRYLSKLHIVILERLCSTDGPGNVWESKGCWWSLLLDKLYSWKRCLISFQAESVLPPIWESW